ncbi:MAG TPA: hypothetical protein VMV74_03735 [Bacteroidales bacterium]|nr:hypothetical protein [Bacteroidales bacterium]
MDDLLKKFRYKDLDRIAVLNAPVEFQERLAKQLPGVQIDNEINARFLYEFMVAFTPGSAEVRELGPTCLHNLSHDGKLWFAYPKVTSKKHTSDINRDHGWESVSEGGFKPVSQISIDSDWSALRFRNIKYVKSRH